MRNLVHPISAGLCVPLFAFTAAGVPLAGASVGEALSSPVALGVILGLVVGKPIGITVTAWAVARFTRASLSSSITWLDVAVIGVLAGIGFTVALLISELAFPYGSTLASAKLAVLVASVAAGIVAAVLLNVRARHYAAIADADEAR